MSRLQLGFVVLFNGEGGKPTAQLSEAIVKM